MQKPVKNCQAVFLKNNFLKTIQELKIILEKMLMLKSLEELGVWQIK